MAIKFLDLKPLLLNRDKVRQGHRTSYNRFLGLRILTYPPHLDTAFEAIDLKECIRYDGFFSGHRWSHIRYIVDWISAFNTNLKAFSDTRTYSNNPLHSKHGTFRKW